MHGVALFAWKKIFYTRRNKKYRNDAQKKPSPLVEDSVSEAAERGKVSRNEKSGFYRTVLNTCLSFLNGGKKRSGIEK